jgi:hypothetical protein
MELFFAEQTLQSIAESAVRCDAHFGERDGALVRQRLCELMAAGNLAIAATVPTLDVMPLASHAGGFALRLRPRLRLIFEIADSPSHVAGNGAVDLAKVDTVRILGIEECDES